MKIALITPAAAGSLNGNRNTALRWARLLRERGHRVAISTQWDGAAADLMLALHARRSYVSICTFNEHHPNRPLIVALTGTDLYRDIRYDANAADSLARASRLIVLQERGALELAPELREKVDVVYQSARAIPAPPPLMNVFEISVLAHLREEKDPFRSALALQFLPDDSRIQVRHYGKALVPELAQTAKQLMREQPRYRWLGERAHRVVAQRLARSRALVISSLMEGGANAASEAIVQGVPCIASDIAGNVGMFGRDYAGYYPVGDERALAALMLRLERDSTFRAHLTRQVVARQPLLTRDKEQKSLLASIQKALGGSCPNGVTDTK